ncbi:MAG: Asp-tRNA(Asn)/Glu-tRNA(Gln) amidotransferase subunit GatA [Holosporales bacterium]|jgi:aspartyl-tRNA(Asn)/glutamyl-tRNA(Gln) amidotransferase subunit A|nr:Asp-tRNA(Asn)/Glu-tRNA(Gln) amidotransferase subunit GatA [Holosporales bacterium]
MLDNLTIKMARTGLKNKDFTSLELVTRYFEKIEKYEDLNAYITLNYEKSIDLAKKADEKIAKNIEGSMLGVPIAMKDLFCTDGLRTTAGSRILENFIPPYESTISQNLLNEGSIILGKTNMDEFAMGSSNLTSYFGPVWLPFRKKSDTDIKLVPGGSSGGSAAAVAADIAVAATGSDTGGSVRQPAAFSGLVGIKPTYGLCSRYGMIAFASSLDQAGPITKTVEDAAIMLNAMAGYDKKDSTSIKVEIPNYLDYVGKSIKGMKIGVAKQYTEGLSDVNIAILEQVKKWLLDAGCEIIDINLETAPYALPSYYIIAPAEASSNLGRYDGVRYGYRANAPKNIDDLYVRSRTEGFGEEVKRRILTGTYVLSSGYYDAYYNRALKIREMIKKDFKDNAFAKVDLVLTMTTPNTAFGIDDPATNDPVTMYLNDIFTVTANIIGSPAISVPVGLSGNDKLPLGVQLIGNHFCEKSIFSVASVIEKSANFAELKKEMSYVSKP